MQYNASNRLHRHRDTGDGHVWRNYAYDSRGNVTNNGTIGFTYDRAERPVSISGGASGSFTYDAHGRRVKQVTGGQTIYSVYSSAGTLLYRDNATTGAATDYIRMGGRAIARVRGSTVEWTYADHLGSPAAAASQTGAILWREDHTPFGEARQAPAGNADNEGFTGHIADAASGLVYMQARYYDPVVGRFLSSDPVGFATGGPAYFNRYAYTANDPVNKWDPDGMAAADCCQPKFPRGREPMTMAGAERGLGSNGQPYGGVRADSQRYGDQFTGATERFAAFTVTAGIGGGTIGTVARFGPGLLRAAGVNGIFSGTVQTSVDIAVSGEANVGNTLIATAAGAGTGALVGAIPSRGAPYLEGTARVMMGGSAGMVTTPLLTGRDTTLADLATGGAVGGIGGLGDLAGGAASTASAVRAVLECANEEGC